MTTLIMWPGQSGSQRNAIYLASDSRITWGSRNRRWDAGRKLFTSRSSADVFAFCGEALFPTQVLGQAIDLIDNGVLFSPNARVDRRHEALAAAIQASHQRRHNAPNHDFQILHVGRDEEGAAATFRAWLIAYSARTEGWSDDELIFDPPKPKAFGSGASQLLGRLDAVTPWPARDHNRVVFDNFCQLVRDESDSISGGVPQLAGLFLAGPAQPIGVVIDGTRYLHGLPVSAVHFGRMQWRDEHFRPIDGRSLVDRRVQRGKARSRHASQRPPGTGNPFRRD